LLFYIHDAGTNNNINKATCKFINVVSVFIVMLGLVWRKKQGTPALALWLNAAEPFKRSGRRILTSGFPYDRMSDRGYTQSE